MTNYYNVYVTVSRKAGGRLLAFMIHADSLAGANTEAHKELARLNVSSDQVESIRIVELPDAR